MRTSLALASLLTVAILAGCHGANLSSGGSTSSSAAPASTPAGSTLPKPARSPAPAPASSPAPSPSPSLSPSPSAPTSSTGAAAVMAQPPLAPSTAGTPTYTVDPAQPQTATNFGTLSALLAATTLKPDDIVEIATGSSYSDIITLSTQHSGAPGHPVVIRAKPGAGYATWDASLMDATTRSRLTSKGYFWEIGPGAHDIEICGIEVENLPVATAAAGPLRAVYFQGCEHVSFHHGSVHDNGSDGFMSTGLDTRVESCEVARNGANDGYTHNFYMEGTGTHIRFNSIHDAVGGINYKDRSLPDADGIAVELAYNWIANAQGGGYELDFANNTTVGSGALSTSAFVIGNVIVVGDAENASQAIAVGDGRVGTVHLVNDTIFAATNTRSLVNVWATVSSVDFTNDIVYGGSLSLVSAASVGTVTGSNVVAPASVSLPASLSSTVTLASSAPAPFAAPPSEAVNAGRTTFALPELVPVFELAKTAAGALQVNPRGDGGATVGASSR